jgi:Uma2 family endonuclease
VTDLAVVRRRALTGGAQPYPQGPEDFGLVVEISSPSTRKTDLFAKPGEYAEAGIPLFWRVDLQPELAVHPFRLAPDGYVPFDVLGSACPVPWGTVELDLRRLVTGR